MRKGQQVNTDTGSPWPYGQAKTGGLGNAAGLSAWVAGKRIDAILPIMGHEVPEMYWAGPALAIVLEDGSALIASCDEEGNAPGDLLAVRLCIETLGWHQKALIDRSAEGQALIDRSQEEGRP